MSHRKEPYDIFEQWRCRVAWASAVWSGLLHFSSEVSWLGSGYWLALMISDIEALESTSWMCQALAPFIVTPSRFRYDLNNIERGGKQQIIIIIFSRFSSTQIPLGIL